MEKVIFRKFTSTDEIIAFFPDTQKDCSKPYFVMSYMHIGQHGEVDYNGLLNNTVLASPEEYKPLKEELESIGYKLSIKRRMSHGK
jgi:hypothetical protein